MGIVLARALVHIRADARKLKGDLRGARQVAEKEIGKINGLLAAATAGKQTRDLQSQKFAAQQAAAKKNLAAIKLAGQQTKRLQQQQMAGNKAVAAGKVAAVNSGLAAIKLAGQQTKRLQQQEMAGNKAVAASKAAGITANISLLRGMAAANKAIATQQAATTRSNNAANANFLRNMLAGRKAVQRADEQNAKQSLANQKRKTKANDAANARLIKGMTAANKAIQRQGTAAEKEVMGLIAKKARARAQATKARLRSEQQAARTAKQAILQQQRVAAQAERARIKGIRDRQRAEAKANREAARGMKDRMQQIRGMGFAASLAASALGGMATAALGMSAKLAAEFEQTQVAFEVMMGGADAAKAKLAELQDFATRTPFTIPGVEVAARQLLASRFSAEDLIPVLKSVGDVAAGIGRGQFGLDRLILNLGQVQRQGKLTGRELRDFAILGVPLAEELAKVIGVDVSAMADLTAAGLISKEMVVNAFHSMGNAGGLFHDMMARQNATLMGQISNLKDVLIGMGRVLGKVILPAVTNLVRVAISLSHSIIGIIKEFKGAVLGALLLASAVGLAAAAMVALTFATMMFGGTKIMVLLAGGMLGAGAIALAVAIGAITGALYQTIQAIMAADTSMISFKTRFGELWTLAVEIWRNLKDMFADLSTFIMETVAEAFNFSETSVIGFFQTAIENVRQFMDWVSLMTTNWKLTWRIMLDEAIIIWIELRTFFQTTMLGMGGSVLIFAKNAIGAFSGLFAGTVKMFIGIGETLVTVFNIAVSTIKGLFTGLWEGIKSKFSGGDFLGPFMAEFNKQLAAAEGRFPAIMGEAQQAASDEFHKQTAGNKFIKAGVADEQQKIRDKASGQIGGIRGEQEKRKRQMKLERESKRQKRAQEDLMNNLPEGPAPSRKRTPAGLGAASKPLIDAGRYGFAEFGNKIQDALLKKDKDKLDLARNDHLAAIAANTAPAAANGGGAGLMQLSGPE